MPQVHGNAGVEKTFLVRELEQSREPQPESPSAGSLTAARIGLVGAGLTAGTGAGGAGGDQQAVREMTKAKEAWEEWRTAAASAA